MALASYDDLKSAVADWLNRSDLASQVPDFITLAEAEITRRVRRRTRRATVTLSTAAKPLPYDCAELRSIRLATGTLSQDVPLVVCTPEILAEMRVRLAETGRPAYAAVVGAELLLVPTPDDAYPAELTYYEQLVPLSVSAPSNALLLEAPDLYLYGALLQAAPFLQHDERIPVWREYVERAVQQLNDRAQREEYSASLRPARLPVVIG